MLKRIFRAFCPACRETEAGHIEHALFWRKKYDDSVSEKNAKISRLIREKQYLTAKIKELMGDERDIQQIMSGLSRFDGKAAILARNREVDRQRIFELEGEIAELRAREGAPLKMVSVSQQAKNKGQSPATKGR